MENSESSSSEKEIKDPGTSSDSDKVNGHNESEEETLVYFEGELPLEVITTVSKESKASVLKVKTNGVLTHRNIFTEAERNILKDIVVKYQAIIDTRSRSKDTFLEKQHAWQKIVIDYNGYPGISPRSVKELRKCWDNMKYRTRQAEKEGLLKLLPVKCEASMEEDLELSKSVTSTENIKNCLEFTSKGFYSKEFRKFTCDNSEPVQKKPRLEAPKLPTLSEQVISDVTSHANFPGGKEAFESTKVGNKPISAALNFIQVKEERDRTKVKNLNLNYTDKLSHAGDREFLPKSVNLNGSPSFMANGLATLHLGSGMTITSHNSNLPHLNELKNHATVNPLPSLKKMSSKQVANGTCKQDKCKNISCDDLLSLSNGFWDADSIKNNFPLGEFKDIIHALLYQRLRNEQQEYEAKMALLQKQLSVYDQQLLYWAKKTQLLGHTRENNSVINEDDFVQ